MSIFSAYVNNPAPSTDFRNIVPPFTPEARKVAERKKGTPAQIAWQAVTMVTFGLFYCGNHVDVRFTILS
ncbi:MAG: hypothetical protein WA323_07460 [Candidatus Nitrosopolaris sp.]